MKKFQALILIILTFSFQGFAQQGKDGVKTVAAANTIVNEYTHLTADAPAGSTVITVNASGLNVNARFAGPLAAGDLILIYQAQGAKLNGVINNTAGVPNDSSWGAVVNYENCGLYEFQEVSSVPNSTTITLDCALLNSYSDTGMVQVVRIPRYQSLTINAAGVMTAQAWNGVAGEGGILVVEVQGNTVVNGKMDVTGLGFRGGVELDNNSNYGGGFFSSISSGEGEDKGESIAGYETKYDPLGGHRCSGAPANGGGGGRCHNAGGGGGSNAGIILNWNGKGNADNSVPSYITAWNLEAAGFATHTSSGGGRGGYTFAANVKDPTVVGPINAAWGGDARRPSGGLGGRPLDYTTGRIFFGGGGGAGDQDNSLGGPGGKGGGIIYVLNYGTISGTGGQINANGAAGGNSVNSFFNNASDGCGGAGGGGAIIINSVGAVSGFTASANGGVGGNQTVVASTNESEGPGGGGGGGYIAISNGAIVQSASGGANGISNSPAVKTKFPSNGATIGGAGTTGQTISNFTISTRTDTICAGSTASLSATLNGTVPAGTTIMWYTTPAGGVSIGSGNPFITPVINSTTVYYAGTCPGTYRVADTVKVLPPPTANAGSNVTVCSGGSTTLTATGGGTYSWSPSTGLSSTTTASTVASPASTTTYTVTVSFGAGCSNSATVTVTVGGSMTLSTSPNTSMCLGGAGVNLSATGATTYSWSPSTGLSSTNISNPVATPASTTTYTVTGSTGSCSGSSTVIVTVNPLPTANAGSNTSYCTGGSTTLNGSGGTTYSWSPAAGLSNSGISNPVANPTSTTTYTLTVTDANGCSNTASVQVTVNPLPVITVSGALSICSGSSTSLTAGGATSYSWTPAAGLSSTTTQNTIAAPSNSMTYTITGTDANNCTNSTTATVVVHSLPAVGVSSPITSTCAPGCISFNGIDSSGNCSTVLYNYGDGNTGSSTGHCYSTPGSYSVVFSCTDANGCVGSVTRANYIQILPTPEAAFTTSSLVISYSGNKPDSVCFNNTSTGAVNWLWNFGNGTSSSSQLPCVSYADSGTYCVTLVVGGASGCQDTALSCIRLEKRAEVTYNIPNVFSPNDDGFNDYFFIKNSGLKALDCKIYDRWGRQLYEINSLAGSWDGTDKGQKVVDGVYYFLLNMTALDGTQKEETGFIQLIRNN